MKQVGAVAGAAVVLAYLIGSVPFGYLLHRRRLRRDIRRVDTAPGRLESELRSVLAGSGPVSPLGTDVLAGALDTAKVLLAATLAWKLVKATPPHRVEPDNLSAVAFVTNQVLVGWQSTALWAGLAAVVAHLAPPWLRFRGGQGQAPALALVLVYFPLGFSAGVAGFFAALAVTRNVARSVLLSLPVFVGYAWLAWLYDWRSSWGVPNGPELTLWAAVLAGVVAARTVVTYPEATAR